VCPSLVSAVSFNFKIAMAFKSPLRTKGTISRGINGGEIAMICIV
jgi:hypothetical protein